MSSNYEAAVDSFLGMLGQTRLSTIDRVWKAFMAYSICLIAESFRNKHYTLTVMNHTGGFRFKCFPQGNPNNYSYFLATKGNEAFEIRLSIDAKNVRYYGLKLNLDVAIIRQNSINAENLVDSGTDLISFMECKNFRGFPELVAGFQGMVYELQRFRLSNNSKANYPIPACLLLSQSGRSILFMDDRYQRYNRSIRIFDMLQPGSTSVTTFVQSWF